MTMPATHDAMSHDPLARIRMGLFSTLIEGDVVTADRVLRRLVDRGMSVGAILEHILEPVQHQFGERWRTGDLTVADEHLSTSALEVCVGMLAAAQEPDFELASAGVICAESDRHSLTGRFVHAALAAAGHPTVHLGSGIPAKELERWAAEAEMDVVLISCTVPRALPGARRCIAGLHRSGVPVMIGGRALGDDDSLARRLGADAWAKSTADAVAQLADWSPDPAVGEAAADVSLAAATQVEHHSSHLVASSLDALGAIEAADRACILECVTDFVGLAGAVALLGETSAWSQQIEWWKDPTSGLGLDRAPQRVADAVGAALEQHGFDELAAQLVMASSH